MSHLITMNVNDRTLYTSTCNNLENKLNTIINDSQVAQNIKNYSSQLLNDIKNIRTRMNGTFASEIDYMNLLSSISTLEKNVANTFDSAIDSKLNDLVKRLESNEVNVNEYIAKHGVLAIETFNYLKNNNITVNKDNFEKYMDVVKNEKIDKEKLRNYIDTNINKINSTQLPNEIKKSLIISIRNKMDIDLIKDMSSIIESQNNSFIRMEEFKNKFKKILLNQKFKILGNPTYEYDDKNNLLITKFNMKNESNNTVQIKLDSELNISYKLGNYIGHACEKTTEKIIQDMEKLGMRVDVINVKRDYEYNDKFMYKKLDNNKKGGK